MSESLLGETTPPALLDGDPPRLDGAEPTPAAAPPAAPTLAAPAAGSPDLSMPSPSMPAAGAAPSPMLNAAGSAPVLSSPDVATAPSLPTLPSQPSAAPAPGPAPAPEPERFAPAEMPADLPTLPSGSVKPAVGEDADDGSEESGEPEHPMAHLMPKKSVPNESSRRAAEIRAAQRKKAKKTKWTVVAVSLVVALAVGPPLGKWLVNAINEAGDTSTEVTE